MGRNEKIPKGGDRDEHSASPVGRSQSHRGISPALPQPALGRDSHPGLLLETEEGGLRAHDDLAGLQARVQTPNRKTSIVPICLADLKPCLLTASHSSASSPVLPTCSPAGCECGCCCDCRCKVPHPRRPGMGKKTFRPASESSMCKGPGVGGSMACSRNPERKADRAGSTVTRARVAQGEGTPRPLPLSLQVCI